MYAKVLIDHKARKGLEAGHGFSCLVEGKILFDTGEDADTFVENMGKMMVKVKDLEGIVISHDHWNHIGGLWEILRRRQGLKVYVCPTVSDTFRRCVEELGGRLVIVDKPMEISENIFITGELKGRYKGEEISEQALVVKGDKGVSVITGCAHPGIVNILKDIKSKLRVRKLYMVFGGFHLEDIKRENVEQVIADFKKLKVKKAGPTHCSGEMVRRMFSSQYHDDYIAIGAGHIIHL